MSTILARLVRKRVLASLMVVSDWRIEKDRLVRKDGLTLCLVTTGNGGSFSTRTTHLHVGTAEHPGFIQYSLDVHRDPDLLAAFNKARDLKTHGPLPYLSLLDIPEHVA